jgi:hypothetical protein
MSFFLRALAALVIAAAPAVAAPGDEACKRELFMADAAISGSYRNMEMGGSRPEEQCAAWRRHVEALRRASAAYGRCGVGPAKTAKTGEFTASIADFQRLIGERCRGK